jgi:energy-coupling factor transporter ATP-binding protein EcfA2
LALVLLAEPNVLIMDEPSNDLDTDMLMAVEDVLDSWPGTLIVVTHDRYLMERVTDSQFALADGHLRHLPGGIDQYLAGLMVPAGASVGSQAASSGGGQRTQAAVSREAKKELAAIERRLERLRQEVDHAGARLAAIDPSDYTAVAPLTDQLDALGQELAAQEEAWLEAAERAGM